MVVVIHLNLASSIIEKPEEKRGYWIGVTKTKKKHILKPKIL